MDLAAIRQAMEHLDAAQDLIEHYNRIPRKEVPSAGVALAQIASDKILFAYRMLEGVLIEEEPRRAAVHAAEAVLGGGEAE